MRNIKYIIVLCVLFTTLCGLTLNAQDKSIVRSTYDGDTYEFNIKDNTATLISIDKSKVGADCDYVIPETITVGRTTYRVIAIDYAFLELRMRKVVVPKSIEKVYPGAFAGEIDSLIIEDSSMALSLPELYWGNYDILGSFGGKHKYFYYGREIPVLCYNCRETYETRILTGPKMEVKTLEVGSVVTNVTLRGAHADTVKVSQSGTPIQNLKIEKCNNLIIDRDINNITFYDVAVEYSGNWGPYYKYTPGNQYISNLHLGQRATHLPDDFYSYFTNLITLHLSSISLPHPWVLNCLPYLKSLTIPSDDRLYTAENNIIYDKAKTTVHFVVKRGQPAKIELPSTVKTIGEAAFANATCNEIVAQGLEKIGRFAFENCSSLTTLTTALPIHDFGSGAFYNCFTLKNVNIDGLTVIPDSLFYKVHSLSMNDGTLDNVQSVGKYAFAYFGSNSSSSNTLTFKQLKTLGTGAFLSSYVTSIEGLPAEIPDSCFYDCKRLVWDEDIISHIERVGNAAFGYAGIDTNRRPNLDLTQFKSIGTGAFEYTNIVSVKGLGSDVPPYSFRGCKYLVLDEKLFHNMETVGEYAFAECRSLIKSGQMKLSRISHLGEYAFYGTNIKTLVIDSPIKDLPDYAFSSCFQLDSVKLHDNIENIHLTFRNCNCDRMVIVLPRNLKSLTPGAFKSTYANIYYLTENPIELEDRIFWMTGQLANCYLYIPKGTIDRFKIVPWIDFFIFSQEYNGLEYIIDYSSIDRYDQRYVVEIDVDDAGIDDITFDIDNDVITDEIPIEYYDLQGRRVVNPKRGLYIRRQGSNTTKVIL